MTTMRQESFTCAVCGTAAEFWHVGSTNTLALPDLDTRPAEMMRSTLPIQVQRCPKCGYCATQVSAPNDRAAAVVATEEYQSQLTDAHYPELANSFRCQALIEQDRDDLAAATWAFIHAAWACDDAHNDPQAADCRTRAAGLLVKAEQKGTPITDQPGVNLAILTDLLRRSGQFDRARSEIETRWNTVFDYTIKNILALQVGLIEEKDTRRHTVEETEDQYIYNPLPKTKN
ncbi:MAG: hypothetical protein WC708_15135 [Lentisphaeria bacterium]